MPTARPRSPSKAASKSATVTTSPNSNVPTWTLTLPAPNSAGQRKLIESDASIVLVEAGTKSGKTSGAILWMLCQAWERPGTRWWWVAPIYRQTEIAFGRIVRMLLRAGMAIEPNQSDMRVPLPNGSVLEFRSGEKPQTLYGEDVHGAVLDEATQGMREEVLFAVQTTLTATRGRLLVLSTPRGRRNWFWKLCQRAKAGAAGYDYVFMRSSENPAVPREKLDDAKRNLPARVYRELFEAEAQEDEASVFRNVRGCLGGELDRRPPSIDELARRNSVAGVDRGGHEDLAGIITKDRDTAAVGLDHPLTRNRENTHQRGNAAEC